MAGGKRRIADTRYKGVCVGSMYDGVQELKKKKKVTRLFAQRKMNKNAIWSPKLFWKVSSGSRNNCPSIRDRNGNLIVNQDYIKSRMGLGLI